VFAAHVRPENLSVSYLAEDERQTKKGDGFMDIRKKTRVFRTSDGFTLTRKVAVWTDGDLTFEDYCGIPIDSEGEPLEGDFQDDLAVKFTEAQKKMEEKE
jgi:hypothetical protein